MSRTSFRLLQNSTSCTSSILHFAQVSSESMPDTVEDARHSSTHADSGESNIDSTVPTMPLKSTSSPECASNPPLSCTPGTNDEQRKAAAAEARLRRRKVLARRNSQSPRRSASRRIVVVPFAGLRKQDTDEEVRYYTLVQPTIEGVESVATKWKDGLVVAIPTECTYEACVAIALPVRACFHGSQDGVSALWLQKVAQLRQLADPSYASRFEVAVPYCVVTPSCVLKRHPILRDAYAPKTYALRAHDSNKAAVVHRFNETVEVLERLAHKLWPGPILIRLGLPSNSPWAQTPFVLKSRPPRIEENTPETLAPSMRHFLTLRCPRHPLAVKARKDVEMNQSSLLISLPVRYSAQLHGGDSSENQPAFCTRARQVISRMAALDGEDCREVFHVPTCEYERPCETVIWLDGRQRMITVQSPAGEAASTTMVQSALRHAAPKTTGNKKERLLTQAIISKWKVVLATSTHTDS